MDERAVREAFWSANPDPDSCSFNRLFTEGMLCEACVAAIKEAIEPIEDRIIASEKEVSGLIAILWTLRLRIIEAEEIKNVLKNGDL